VLLRVLLDTNVLISYLLSSARTTSAAGATVQAAIDGRYRLPFTVGVAEELDRKLNERPDLAARIPRTDAADLVALMDEVADHLPRLPEPFPAIGRDRKDDFLIAHAIVAVADLLVSWDKDLTDLVEVEGVRIVSPPEFLHILRERGSRGQ